MSIIDGSTKYEVRTIPSLNDLRYRQPNTTYAVGDILLHESLKPNQYLEVTKAGTSASGDLVIS